MKNIIISDPSLRDGNHSVKHSISKDSIIRYCQFAEKANIPIVEVGQKVIIGEALTDGPSIKNNEMVKFKDLFEESKINPILNEKYLDKYQTIFSFSFFNWNGFE